MVLDVRKRVMEIHLQAEKHIIHNVREQFETFVKPCDLPQDDIEWIKVAVSEACTNAVCHGSPKGAQNQIHIRWEVDAETLSITVCDEGGRFKPEKIALPELDEWRPSGRGLVIMVSVMDDVTFEPTDHGTCVRMVKYLRNPESNAPQSEDDPAEFCNA
jgi:serine/threonine-protein kinase RsbW